MTIQVFRTLSLSTLAALTLGLGLSQSVLADQPKMEAALAALQQARAELRDASDDKGGHRAKALRAVEVAIEQVQAGIQYDRTHVRPGEKLR